MERSKVSNVQFVGHIMFAIVFGMLAVSQYIAFSLEYSEALGGPIYLSRMSRGILAVVIFFAMMTALGKLHRGEKWVAWMLIVALLPLVFLLFVPFYSPMQLVAAMRRGFVTSSDLQTEQIMWLGSSSVVVALGIQLLFASRFMKGKNRSDEHGSARFASEREIKASGLFANEGIVVGFWKKTSGGNRLLRYNGDGHVLVASPTRSGKGVGIIVPTALLWEESMLIHDVKGELWSLTAGRRKFGLNNRCIRFDGTCRDETAARWNPLDEIREYPLDYKDAQHIAEALEDDEATKHTYWDEMGKAFLVGLILHQKYCCRDKSLAGCCRTITDPNRPLREVLIEMLSAVHDPDGRCQWVDRETGEGTDTHPSVAAAARTLLNRADGEQSGIDGAVSRLLVPFRDPVIAQNSSESDFSVNDLMNHKQPVSVYLTTPAADVSRVKALHKLLFTLVTHRATEHLEFSNGEPVRHYKHKLLLVFDECAQLGKLPILSQQLSLGAGFGLQCLLVFQDLSQIYEIYGKNESITSNSDVRILFAPNKIDTARELSRLLGVTTRVKQRKSFSGPVGSLVLSNMNASEHHTQRSLMTEDEILRLPNSECILVKNGIPAIRTQKLRYHEWKRFRELCLDPPSKSDTTSEIFELPSGE